MPICLNVLPDVRSKVSLKVDIKGFGSTCASVLTATSFGGPITDAETGIDGTGGGHNNFPFSNTMLPLTTSSERLMQKRLFSPKHTIFIFI